MFSILRRAVPLLAVLCLTSSALGRTITDVQGGWTGPVVTKVSVRGLGGDRSTSIDVVSVGDGTWSSQNSNGWQYLGTWVPAGRKMTWTFDAASYAELESMLDSWASNRGLPGANASVTSTSGKAKAKENRKGRKLTVKAKVRFTATLRNKIRNGKLMIKGRYTPD